MDEGYFRQASEQIGTNVSNDFISGELHRALRQQLFDGINAGDVPAAIPLATLPLTIDVPSSTPPAVQNLMKLEAPLAVQSRTLPGLFPFNKFSAVPLLIRATRSASFESMKGLPYPDDVKKRIMVVPQCHVIRLVTDVIGGVGRVMGVLVRVYTGFCSSAGVQFNDVTIPVPDNGKVIIALGTIESTRLALLSFQGITNYPLIGKNLIGHLRSNLTISIPREALVALDPAVKALQASALFVKGRHTHTDGMVGHFHLQITAAGLERPGTDSEAELFKKVPDLEMLDAMRRQTTRHVIITIRGIGETEPQNPDNIVTLDSELDEVRVQRARVVIADPHDPQQRPNNPKSAKDFALWKAMDKASDDVAKVFAGTQAFKVLTRDGFKDVAAGDPTNQLPVLMPYTYMADGGRRDGLGTTHHEAGPLWMGDNPATSVTDVNGRFHFVSNAYVASPALFPTVGSPNPMLTGVALARRLADHLARSPRSCPTPASPCCSTASTWTSGACRPSRTRRTLTPGHSCWWTGRWSRCRARPWGFYGTRIRRRRTSSLSWSGCAGGTTTTRACSSASPTRTARVTTTRPTWRSTSASRSRSTSWRRPMGSNPPDRRDLRPGRAGEPGTLPVNPPGQWNEFEIRVQGQDYTVILNGQQITTFTFIVGSDPAHPDRGLPTTAGDPGFIGLQTHTGRVAFRKIQIRPLP